MTTTIDIAGEEDLVRRQTIIGIAFAIGQQPNDHVRNTVLWLNKAMIIDIELLRVGEGEEPQTEDVADVDEYLPVY